jgi:hypothetical protein
MELVMTEASRPKPPVIPWGETKTLAEWIYDEVEAKRTKEEPFQAVLQVLGRDRVERLYKKQRAKKRGEK